MAKAKVDYLNPQEITQLISILNTPRDHAIITLCLGTGLFIKELVQLNLTDINWDQKQLTVTGDRPRILPINDDVYRALVDWNNSRPKTPITEVFVTTKGHVSALKKQNFTMFFRHCGFNAKLPKRVGIHHFRATFAIRLFRQGLSLYEVAQFMGMDPRWLVDYQKRAAQPDHEANFVTITQPSAVDALDNRSVITRFIHTRLQKPPVPKPTTQVPITTPSDTPVCIGRDQQLKDIVRMISKGQSILLTGGFGIGKTHLMQAISHMPTLDTLYIQHPIPLKSLLLTICNHVSPDWKDTPLKKTAPTSDWVNYLSQVPLTTPPILIIDNLQQLKSYDVSLIQLLLDRFTVLGATDDKVKRLKHFWLKFKEIELDPLSDDDIRALIAHSTSTLTVQDYDMLETHLVTQSNGYPLVVIDLINQLNHCTIIKADAIRELHHSAGTRYRDWTSSIIIFWALIVTCRFIAFGMNNTEGYILAGIGATFFIVIKFFALRMR